MKIKFELSLTINRHNPYSNFRQLNKPDDYLYKTVNYAIQLILHTIVNTPNSPEDSSVAMLYKNELLNLFQIK